MKNKLFSFIRIFISFSLLGLLLWLMREEIPNIITTIKNSDKGFVLIGFFIYILGIIIIAFRLLRVLSVQAIRLTPKEAIYLTFIGYFFNNFLPTSFGGDILKAYYAGKKYSKKAGAFAGVLMDRILAMLPFTLIPAFIITFLEHRIENRTVIVIVYAIFIACVSLLWCLLNRKTTKYLVFIFKPFRERPWYEKMKKGYNYLNLYARHKIILFWSFLLSVLAQAMCIIATYFFARALGVDYVSMGIFFIIVPVVWIMTLAPSLNGLGVREGTFVYLLKDYMPAEKAFAISILVLASLAIFSIIGGIIYSFKKDLFRFKKEGIV